MSSLPKAPEHRGDIESVPTSAGLGYSQSSALVQAFDKFASWVTRWTGSPIAFALAIVSIVVWMVTGPIFHYSDTWQLVINTGTTIVTFLMVFLIQESQNKDSIAVHMKLNELLASQKDASNRMVGIEDASEDDLRRIAAFYARLAANADCNNGTKERHSIDEEMPTVEKQP